MKIPKVLILIQPFNQNTGGGITLSNLFRGWPKENLAVLCRGYVIDSNTQTDICDTYYQLGHKEHILKFPFSKFARKYYSGLLKINKRQTGSIDPRKPSLRQRLLNDYIQPFLKWAGVQNFISKIVLSQDLKDWLDVYQPDIIYAQAQGRDTTLFCSAIQDYVGKPMVFHMMDDWVQLEKEGLLGRYWHPKVDLEFRQMLSKCSLHLSISDAMAIEYKRRYGYEFKTFHNPTDLNFWRKGQKKSWELAAQPTILYAGRTGLGIEESLKMMAKAVTQLNKELDVSITFILQVNEKPDWMDKFPCIEHRSFVKYENLPQKFAEADILYLPYDFSSSSVKYIKYSMPTKASEYMISGTPILIFAPFETAIVHYAQQHNWAKVVTDNKENALKTALKELILSQEERENRAQTAIQLAESKHDAVKVRTNFKRALTSLLEKPISSHS